MSVRMRHTKGHTGNRRSHHALKGLRLSNCSDCGAMHMRHKVCGTCGNYRGKKVVDMVAVVEKKAQRAKAKAKTLGKEVAETKETKKKESSKKK